MGLKNVSAPPRIDLERLSPSGTGHLAASARLLRASCCGTEDFSEQVESGSRAPRFDSNKRHGCVLPLNASHQGIDKRPLLPDRRFDG